MRNRMSGSSPTSPVAAAHPITGGSAPAAPPMTMFCGVAPLQPHRVHDDVEEDREGEQRCRCEVGRQSQDARLHCRRERGRKTSASAREILPRGIGRIAVRVMTASMSASYHMLSTPAAPAPAAMARIATNAKQRIKVRRRNHQSDERGEDGKHHHARLHQRDKVGPIRECSPPSSPRRRGPCPPALLWRCRPPSRSRPPAT